MTNEESKPIFYTDAVKRATIKYENKNIKRVVLKLNKKTDTDIIEYLEDLDNVNKFLKEIIRKKIKG